MKSFLRIILLFTLQGLTNTLYGQIFQTGAPNATQAVAVDSHHIYTISNSKIVKRDKLTGDSITEWQGPLQHLNSGIVLEEKLYCANSNYPMVPMTSSLEIFDTRTMEHLGTHSFGVYVGSFTWIDRRNEDWYLMFVHYENKAQDLGRGAAYTTLVQMDSLFRRKGGWTLPPAFTDHLKPMSVSGGTFISDDTLILSPHHFPELYKFRIPKMGYHLEWIETIPSPFQGQGIAIDPSNTDLLFGIHRKDRMVKAMRIEK